MTYMKVCNWNRQPVLCTKLSLAPLYLRVVSLEFRTHKICMVEEECHNVLDLDSYIKEYVYIYMTSKYKAKGTILAIRYTHFIQQNTSGIYIMEYLPLK